MKIRFKIHNLVLLFILLSFSLDSLSALTSQIPLKQGWNLISLGLTPASGSIEVIFAGCPDMKYVLGFFRLPVDAGTEGFRIYMNLDIVRDFSTLRTMDGLHGYWAYMSKAATLEVSGIAIADTREWSLESGWNLAGYWLSTSNSLPTMETQTGTVIDSVFNLTSIDGVARYISGFYRPSDGGSEGFRTFINNAAIGFSTLQTLDPNHGYWYYMDRPGTLKYLSGLPTRSLTGVTISPSSINLHPGTSYTLSNIKVTAVYSNGSQETATGMTWNMKSGGGALSTYTAPDTDGTDELVVSFSARNITATQELTVNIITGPLPQHALTVTLAPAEAVSDGVQWSINHGSSWSNSGDTVGVEENSLFTIECKAASGWIIPAAAVSTMRNEDQAHTLTYVQIPGVSWHQATAEAAFQAVATSGLSYNGKMWVIGGEDYQANKKNEVWNSTDGADWTQVTANAAFSARSRHTCLVFDNKMWVIGGYTTSYLNDVWYSADGTNWTEATSEAAFSVRGWHTSLVFDNKMWVIGGYSKTGYLNDVWYSANGVNWTEATSGAAFSARKCHASIVFDNKMWVIGGYSTGIGNQNDVWSSGDGSNWVQSTASTAFSPRGYLASLVFDEKMWVIGGCGSDCYSDVWSSPDGSSWTLVTASSAFAPRYSLAGLSYDNRIWAIGGICGTTRDIWYTGTASPALSPLYITTSPLTLEVTAGSTFELSTIKKTVFYSSGTTQEASGLSYIPSSGSVTGTLYTAPGSGDSDTLEISCTESGRTITTHLRIKIWP
ncbi:MAG: hypothetical protein PHW04_08740 [Candidatus Wallbacteria bacterium]|nr:hypothetical protein [Candidatus Wallbacteria bacterium]